LLVVAPVALLLLQRLHEICVHLVDRVLNRRFHAIRKRLKEVGDIMLKARNFDDVDRLLVNAPVEALNLSSGAVFRQQDNVFRRGHSIGWDGSPLRELWRGEDAGALRSLNTSPPVRLPRVAWDRPGLAAALLAPPLPPPVVG